MARLPWVGMADGNVPSEISKSNLSLISVGVPLSELPGNLFH